LKDYPWMLAAALENISTYQNLERQVRERTRELQALNQELEAFSAAVSHDLRAPLRAMNAQLDTLAKRCAPLAAEPVARLRECTDRMGHLIHDLLRLSKISRAELRVERVDLGSMAVRILQRLRAGEPGRNLEMRIEAGQVEADGGLMNVVLENLLSNAWKYTAKREVSRIELVCEADAGGRLVYCIRDNGAGFDERYADQLFKPFARLHDARDYPGIGVGLATVQRIIHRHGGEIWARSAGRDHGARFMFTLGPA
ncbi:MAG: sensor histidine kinase, partial [Steroidobacteraceae bacterium]